MAIADVIRWNDNLPNVDINDIVAVRHPIENFTSLTEILVDPSQSALVFAEDTYIGKIDEGRKNLSEYIANKPGFEGFAKKVYNGKTPYTAYVYYVNRIRFTNIRFGTGNPIQMTDPVDDCDIEVSAYGAIRAHIEICDAKTFRDRLVGVSTVWTKEQFVEEFRAEIMNNFEAIFREVLENSGKSVLKFGKEKLQVAKAVSEALKPIFEDYGLTIDGLAIESMTVEGEGLKEAEERRMKEREAESARRRAEQEAEAEKFRMQKLAEGEAARLAAIGGNLSAFDAETRRQAMVAAASNEGQAGSFMGAGMGLGMGVGMGGVFGAGMANMAQNTFQQQPYMQQQPYGQQPPMTPPPIQQVAFHVAINGQTYGPYDMNALSQMLANGSLTRDTLVWKQGMPSWAQASMVPELQQLFSVPPLPGNVPPVPPAPPVPPTL